MFTSLREFFTKLRYLRFRRAVDNEIFNRMFSHLTGDAHHDYPFETSEEMNSQTDRLEVLGRIEDIEEQIRMMPKAYGECFRHILHRDLTERLKLYAKASRRRVQRDIDPRYVATKL